MKTGREIPLILAMTTLTLLFAGTGVSLGGDLEIGTSSGPKMIVAQTAASNTKTETLQPDTKNVPVTEVEVKGGKIEKRFIERKEKETTTESTLTRETIAQSAGPAQTSVFRAIEMLPSVHVETQDPYGFTFSPTAIRIRGQQAIGMSTMIEGVPNWAISSPGPRADMFDVENIQSITVYRGAIPSGDGLGAQNTAGVLDISILKPADTFGALVKQSVGSYNFLRSFARIDSGKLPTGTKFYISGSHSAADKWKGEGGSPDYRNHVSFAAVQPFSSKVKAEVFIERNKEKMFSYKGLTYAQTKDLSTYGRLDYNQYLTGKPAQDINYYDFNRTSDQSNFSAIGVLSIAPSESSMIAFRPYYYSEDKSSFSGKSALPGTTTPGVYEQACDFDRHGSVLEYKTLLAGTDAKFGYWYESFYFPITEYYYTISGGSMVYNRKIFSRPDGRGYIHSPYVRITKDFFKDLRFDLGLRYLYLQSPGMTGYYSASAVNDPNDNYDSRVNREWLPYASASYKVNPNISIYASYGRNYARPHGYPQLYSAYISNKAAYNAKGINMQYLADQVKLAISDNYDLGLRFSNKWFYVSPALFYADYSNKLFSVYDPAVNTTLRQSIGKSRVLGAELEAGINPLDNLTLFGSISYNQSEVTENFNTASNTLIEAKGNQTPDTPKILAKFGLAYQLYGLEATPIIKYVGSRYGDVLQKERVPAYWLVDLGLNYKMPKVLDFTDTTVGVSVQNLLDETYVGAIGSFDDKTAGGSYQLGAPRTFAATLTVKF